MDYSLPKELFDGKAYIGIKKAAEYLCIGAERLRLFAKLSLIPFIQIDKRGTILFSEKMIRTILAHDLLGLQENINTVRDEIERLEEERAKGWNRGKRRLEGV